MKKLAVFLGSTVLALGLSSCGYDGQYRYPCQDPVNWETPECKPPVCTAAGYCPVDLVGEEVFNSGTTTTDSGATPNG
jgi:hypothetical protein